MLPPLDYWLLRTIRRNLPQAAIDRMLDRGLVIKPGRDTSEPDRVARDHAERAAQLGIDLAGKTVCVVGYGGGHGVGLHLLERGAARVILQDPFAPERRARNRAIPRALRDRHFSGLEIVHQPLEQYARRRPASVDLVVSSSVLEHVEDVPSLVRACAELTAPGGANLHLIDLRDHFFKHPFEMLCYDERTWRRWLNASNNLNRLRLPAYRAIFAAAFEHVRVEVESHLRDEFRRARPRIRSEFLTGDEGRVEARPT